MSRFAVAVMYEDHRTAGRTSYKLRLGILDADSHPEALGKYLIEENPRNYGSVMTYSVNLIEELSDQSKDGDSK